MLEDIENAFKLWQNDLSLYFKKKLMYFFFALYHKCTLLTSVESYPPHMVSLCVYISVSLV